MGEVVAMVEDVAGVMVEDVADAAMAQHREQGTRWKARQWYFLALYSG